jgi:hypothetical protein
MKIKKEIYMKTWKHTLFMVFAILAIVSLVLSACGPIDQPHGKSNNEKDKDKDKGKDKDKENGKDKNKNINADKITICHKTGSAKNPYVEISVSNDAVKEGHGTHEGDLIPAPEGGCP